MAKQLMNLQSVYAKDKNLKKDDVQLLIDWTVQTEDLPEISEEQAILFLQKADYQIEPAKTAIDAFFTFKTSNPDLFTGRSLSNESFKDNLDHMMFTVLPKKTPEGYSIIFAKVIDFSNIDKWDIMSITKQFIAASIISLHEEGVSMDYIYVMDFQNFPEKFVTQLDLPSYKKCLNFIETVMPWDLKALHYINPEPFMDEFVAKIKPFMKRIGNSIFVHDTIDDLVKYVPRECLPKDYGGEADDIATLHQNYKDKVEEHEDFFDYEEKQFKPRKSGKGKKI